jgi:O-antigen/teichoic acid export membrane protein
MQWTSGNLFVLAAPAVYGASAAGVLRVSQNLMGVTHIWLQGLENSVPVRAARKFHEGGVQALQHYIFQVTILWGGLTLAFASIIAIAPGFWLRLLYGSSYAHYGYVLRWYALLYVLIFVGLPLRSGLRALEHTKPIFISYTAMTAFAVLFAFPFAKHLGLSGAMIGLIGTQIIFQSVLAYSFQKRISKSY